MQETLAKCQRVSLEDWARRPFMQKLLAWVLRPLAPLM